MKKEKLKSFYCHLLEH